MKKTNQKLSEVLNIEPIEIESTEIIDEEEVTDVVTVDTDVNSDANFARDNIRELISKGTKALDSLSIVARESEHPRAYEVLATMMKNISDMNKDLMEIQKRKMDLNPREFKDKSQINVDKAVFVGSTADLVKYLKTKKQEIE